jgi:ankyrin repeat protein
MSMEFVDKKRIPPLNAEDRKLKKLVLDLLNLNYSEEEANEDKEIKKYREEVINLVNQFNHHTSQIIREKLRNQLKNIKKEIEEYMRNTSESLKISSENSENSISNESSVVLGNNAKYTQGDNYIGQTVKLRKNNPFEKAKLTNNQITVYYGNFTVETQLNIYKYKFTDSLDKLNIDKMINNLVQNTKYKEKLKNLIKAIRKDSQDIDVMLDSISIEKEKSILPVINSQLAKICNYITQLIISDDDMKKDQRQKDNIKIIMHTIEQLFRQKESEFLDRLNFILGRNEILMYPTSTTIHDIEAKNLSEQFTKVLQSISKFYLDSHKYQRRTCLISYAWPTKSQNKTCEPIMHQFLKLFEMHLNLAGINTYLDIENELNLQLIYFYKTKKHYDYVILICTKLLLEKYRTECNDVCNELEKIKNERENQDFDMPPKIFPIYIDNVQINLLQKNKNLYIIEKDWCRAPLYFINLKDIIKTIYCESKGSSNYESLWANFEKVYQNPTTQILAANSNQTELQNTGLKLDIYYFDNICNKILLYKQSGEIDLIDIQLNFNKLIDLNSPYLKRIKEMLHESKSEIEKKTLLHFAVKESNIEMVNLLLKITNKLVDEKDILGKTPLYYCAENNSVPIAYSLISASADVNSKNKENITVVESAAINGSLEMISIFLTNPKINFTYPLYRAIQNEKISIVKEILLSTQVDINKILSFKEIHEHTYLCEACENGNKDIIDLLLDLENIDVNRPKKIKKENLGITPLQITIINNKYDIVLKLIANPSIKVNIEAFYFAAYYGYNEILDKLLLQYANKIDINQPLISDNSENNSDTTFAAACRNGKLITVNILLKQSKININIPGKENLPPIFLSAKQGHFDIFLTLLDHSSINLEIKNEQSILHYLIQNNFSIKYIKAILGHKGLNFNIFNKDNFTAFHLAVLNNKLDVVELLINNVDINLLGKDNFSPLYFAFEKNNLNLVEILITNQKIDINVIIENNTVAHIAIKNKYYQLLEILLDKCPKFNRNLLDAEGNSILHLICKTHEVNLLKKLLANEIKLFSNKFNFTPLYYLLEEDNLEMFRILFDLCPTQSIEKNNEYDQFVKIFYYAISFNAKKIYRFLLTNYIQTNEYAELLGFYEKLLFYIVYFRSDRLDMINLVMLILAKDKIINELDKKKLPIKIIYLVINHLEKNSFVSLEKKYINTEDQKFLISIDKALVTLLQNKSSDVNFVSLEKKCTILYHILSMKPLMLNIFKKLLDFNHLNINYGFRDEKNNIPPIYIFAKLTINEVEQMEFLSNKNLNLHEDIIIDNKKISLLETAVDYRNLFLIRFILQDIHSEKTYSSKDLFWAACLLGDDKLVDTFYSKIDLKPDFCDESNLLVIAINKSKKEFIPSLLKVYLKYYDFDALPFDVRIALLKCIEKSHAATQALFDESLLKKLENPNIQKRNDYIKVIVSTNEKYIDKPSNITSLPVTTDQEKINTSNNILSQNNESKNTNFEINILEKIKDIIDKNKPLEKVDNAKKEILNNFLFEICHNQIVFDKFIKLDFSILGKCTNKVDIFKILKISTTEKNHFATLLSELIVPRSNKYSTIFSASTCAETSTYQILNELHIKFKECSQIIDNNWIVVDEDLIPTNNNYPI